jgi:nucleoside phosphorylase
LLLLAKAVNDGDAAQRLRELLGEAEGLSPLASLLAAVACATKEGKVLLDEARPADMALCVLSGDVLAKRIFPGTDHARAGKKLAEHACMGRVVPSADISSMLILAALEASVAHEVLFPAEITNTSQTVDVAIVVALKEEFRELFDVIEDRCQLVEDGDRHYYRFDTPGPPGSGPYRCIATFAGEMGPTTAGVVTEKTLERWRPTTVVNLGIAAGIHDDVRVGDVVVASQVDNYLDSAKATGPGQFQRSGNGYQTDHALLERVRNFEFTHATLAQRWRSEAGERLGGLEIDVDVLVKEGLLRDQPEQLEAHIASGPVVAADADFVAWVREGDRAYKVLEMESGGLVTAAHMSAHGTKALVLRAVSDFGDDRKARLDSVGRGALRRYAMRNTIEFLWALLGAGLLGRIQATGVSSSGNDQEGR